MFPFPFLLFGGFFGKWFDDLLKNSTVNNNNNNNSFFINNWRPSDAILQVKGKIEGFSNVAYQRVGDPVTVGTGLTYFSDGSKPVKGKYYSTDYLNSQAIIVSKVYVDRTKAFASACLVPLSQKQLDVIYYLFFNGFTKTRQDNLKKNLSTDVSFANWLLTRNGIGANFLTGSDCRFFVGIFISRFRLANYLMGFEIDKNLSIVTNQFPKNGRFYDQVASAKLYNQGKIKIPAYL
ncbi:hypothetical protein SAMN05421847_0474 [Halpernia humi]|uniref:Lysozyme n=1 Tax=Halpernia humi TaxID=493375 RepID=A0A1H5TJ02_9FLAO|nr:hypothetical protein [Halpernia humi]SEF62158.1 hypothetical protein SAMN05421847_0474 [Halpernia humi]